MMKKRLNEQQYFNVAINIIQTNALQPPRFPLMLQKMLFWLHLVFVERVLRKQNDRTNKIVWNECELCER